LLFRRFSLIEKKPISRRELNALIEAFLLEDRIRRSPISELYDDSKWFTKKDLDIDFDPTPKPFMLFDPEARDIPRSWNSDGIPDIEGLKVMQQNPRALGELLLEDDVIALNAGAVASTAFRTRGWHNLLVTQVNPAWATNPTALVCGLHLSTDAFDTEDFTLIARNGVDLQQICSFADSTYTAYYLPVGSNVGVPTATSMPIFVPIPDIDGLTAHILYTPTGAAITAETMTVNVYGVTSR
jgi:hypothetical protein